MKIKILLLFVVLLSVTVFATVDRVIDPEIPIDDEFVDFEQDFDDLVISVFQVFLLAAGSIAGFIFVGWGILFVYDKVFG